jgi:hypothetical protein
VFVWGCFSSAGGVPALFVYSQARLPPGLAGLAPTAHDNAQVTNREGIREAHRWAHQATPNLHAERKMAKYAAKKGSGGGGGGDVASLRPHTAHPLGRMGVPQRPLSARPASARPRCTLRTQSSQDSPRRQPRSRPSSARRPVSAGVWVTTGRVRGT